MGKNNNLWKESIVLLVIFLLLHTGNIALGRSSTAEQAIINYGVEERWEFVDLIPHSENINIAFYVDKRNWIKAVHVSKNLFGWKATTSIESSLKIENFETGGTGGFNATSELVYGTYDGLYEYKGILNGKEVDILKVSNHNYTIWFTTEIFRNEVDLKFYDSDNKLVFEYK